MNISWCDRAWCFCKKSSRKGGDSAATTAATTPEDVADSASKAGVLGHVDKQKSFIRRDSQDSSATAATSDDDDSDGVSELRWEDEKNNSTPLNDVKLPATGDWWCQPCDLIPTETRQMNKL